MAYVYDSDDDEYCSEYEEEEEEEEEGEAYSDDDDVPQSDLWRAVDVKFVRVAPPDGGAPQTVLAAVAVVDAQLRVRFFSFARPRGAVLSAAGAPGIDADELNAAPDAGRVAAAAADALRGCMLIAHGAGLALRLLGLRRDELACVYDVHERGAFSGLSFRNAAACLGFSPDAVSPAYWPAPRVACALMQLASLSLEEDDDVANYLERVLRFLGRCDGNDSNGDAYAQDAEERRAFYSFGELGNACAMPPELRCDFTYPRLFEEHAWWCFQVSENRNAIRPRPLPWHVPPTRVETAAEGAARRACAYEAQLVAFIADRSGSAQGGVNVGFVGTHCPLPDGGLGEPTLGAFLRARPALFTRSACGNYVWLTPAPAPQRAPAAARAAPPAPAPAAAAAVPRAQAPQQQQRAAAPPRPAPAAADRSCAVCMASPKEGAFLPGMHKCCCMACGEAIMRRTALCPICRCEADRFAFVYE
jgi:hypothetical protein